MKKGTKYILVIIVIGVIGLIIYQASGDRTVEPSKYDDFAKCLTEKGVVMYGAYWCPHCANQKKLFGDSWQYVTYVECDARGDNANPDLCKSKGVSGYPTWIFADGTRASKVLTLTELSVRSSCALPQ